MLTELSIMEFASRLASDKPTPGGGSAAALSGLMGTCLMEMVINLSVGRKDLLEYSSFLTLKQAELSRIHIELQLLIERDAQAFASVMAAYQLPKNTEEEKKLRQEAVQKAFTQAAEIPLDTARTCLEALEIGRALCGKINNHAASDLAVGAISVHSGAIGALLNTAINLPFINDKNLASALDGQVHLLRSSVDEIIADIKAAVYADEQFAAFRS